MPHLKTGVHVFIFIGDGNLRFNFEFSNYDFFMIQFICDSLNVHFNVADSPGTPWMYNFQDIFKTLNSFVAGNQATSKVTEERDAALGQVEFLNSVIVDLQKKNNEFKTRLEIMESGVVTNGDGDSSMESE